MKTSIYYIGESTTGRIINDYRCLTTPETVEALVCTHSLIRDEVDSCETLKNTKNSVCPKKARSDKMGRAGPRVYTKARGPIIQKLGLARLGTGQGMEKYQNNESCVSSLRGRRNELAKKAI
ncbi:hypothetical protein EJ110_NYTH34794 [Nymphaea thermarum]|nr:hypothetical protein EJ110_NYTH34794 [Nymphaea thermarum]